jgi:hypothetical protein
MKKTIIICVFVLLILVTAFGFVKGAIDSYNYDMDPNNGVDLLEGLGAVFALIIGAFVVLYELDLFYVVYYFCFKQKTAVKSVMNIAANLSFVLVFGFSLLSNVYMELRVYEWLPVGLFGLYLVLRIVYFVFLNITSDH